MASSLELREIKLQDLMALDNSRVVEAFNQAVKRAADDCKDRPAVKDAREVNMVMLLSPVADESGAVESVKVRFQIKDTCPERKSKIYDFGLRQTRAVAQLIFNAGDPTNVDQHTMFNEDEAQQQLHDRLIEAGVPVFYGRRNMAGSPDGN